MAAKLFAVVALAAVASAVPLAPLHQYAEEHAPAHYEFSYSVHDEHSGDVKQQTENRQGDAVHGSYSLLQPDGLTRIVDYSADKEHGFNAQVRYEGHAKPAPEHKIVYAAPAHKIAYAAASAPKIAYAAAPVAKIAYAAPAPKIAYAAPVAKIAYTAPAPKIAYAAPAAKIAYAPAPVAYSHAPVSYATAPAKVAYAAAPSHAYTENLGHVTFSSPAISYHH